MSNVHFIRGGDDAVGMIRKERPLGEGHRIVVRDDPSLVEAVVLPSFDRAAFDFVETLDGESGIAAVRHGASRSRDRPGACAVIGSRRARTIIAGLASAS